MVMLLGLMLSSLAGVAGGGEHGVDRGGVGGGDGDGVGLVELAVLEVGEVEGAVFADGAAERGAGLGLGVGQQVLGEGVAGVEVLVAKVAVDVAVQLVAAGFGDEVDVAAEGAAELGLAAAGDDLHLLDDVEAEGGLDEAGGVIVGGEAVDDEASWRSCAGC